MLRPDLQTGVSKASSQVWYEEAGVGESDAIFGGAEPVRMRSRKKKYIGQQSLGYKVI